VDAADTTRTELQERCPLWSTCVGHSSRRFVLRYAAGGRCIGTESVEPWARSQGDPNRDKGARAPSARRPAFQTGSDLQRLVWVDRRGVELGSAGSTAAYLALNLSRDGMRVLASRLAAKLGTPDIWLIDFLAAPPPHFRAPVGPRLLVCPALPRHPPPSYIASRHGRPFGLLSVQSRVLQQGLDGFAWQHESSHHEFDLMRRDGRIQRLLLPIGLGS